MFKKTGLHHLVIGLPLAFFAGPLANALFWFGKELGEAIGRAGGTREAFSKKRGKDYYGRDVPVWQHWDWITPSIAGYILYALRNYIS